VAHHNDTTLPGSFGHWGDAAQTIIASSTLQGIRSLCEQRGEDDPSDARQGSQNRYLALLMAPPLGAVLCSNEPFGQTVEQPVCLDKLSVDQFKPLCHSLEMGGRRSDRARCNRHRRRLQSLQNLRRVEAPNAVRLQQALKRLLPDAHRLVGHRYQSPQVEKPFRRNIIRQLKHLRIVTPEQLAKTIAESVPFSTQILSNPRPLPQFDDNRIQRCDRAQAVRSGPECVGKHLGIDFTEPSGIFSRNSRSNSMISLARVRSIISRTNGRSSGSNREQINLVVKGTDSSTSKMR
jgi:hypothetical protein